MTPAVNHINYDELSAADQQCYKNLAEWVINLVPDPPIMNGAATTSTASTATTRSSTKEGGKK